MEVTLKGGPVNGMKLWLNMPTLDLKIKLEIQPKHAVMNMGGILNDVEIEHHYRMTAPLIYQYQKP